MLIIVNTGLIIARGRVYGIIWMENGNPDPYVKKTAVKSLEINTLKLRNAYLQVRKANGETTL